MKTVSMQDLVNVIDEKNETIKEEKTYSSGLEGIVREQKKAMEAQAKEIADLKKAIKEVCDSDNYYSEDIEHLLEIIK